MSRSRSHSAERPCFAKAVEALRITDDEVIEKRHVENISRRTESERQSRIVRTGRRVAARMVVNDHYAGRARCETRGHEDIRYADGRAVARTARDHVPGQETVLRREACDRKHLDGLIGQ